MIENKLDMDEWNNIRQKFHDDGFDEKYPQLKISELIAKQLGTAVEFNQADLRSTDSVRISFETEEDILLFQLSFL